MMNDLIKRQDALYIASVFCSPTYIANRLASLPSAQPEQKVGHWIDVNGDGSLYECDQCHDRSCCKGKYCMECGAKMGVEHETD